MLRAVEQVEGSDQIKMLLLDSVCGFEQTIQSVLRFSSGCFRGAGLSDADDREVPPAQAFYPTSIL